MSGDAASSQTKATNVITAQDQKDQYTNELAKAESALNDAKGALASGEQSMRTMGDHMREMSQAAGRHADVTAKLAGTVGTEIAALKDRVAQAEAAVHRLEQLHIAARTNAQN